MKYVASKFGKPLLVAAIAAGVWIAASAQQWQAQAPEVGYINIQRVTESFPAYTKAQSQLRGAEERYQAEFTKRLKRLEEAEKSGKSQAELQKLKNQFEKELGPMQTKGVQLYQQLLDKLRKDLENTVAQVAREKRLNMVLDKQAVFYGGTDITQDVANRLKSKK